MSDLGTDLHFYLKRDWFENGYDYDDNSDDGEKETDILNSLIGYQVLVIVLNIGSPGGSFCDIYIYQKLHNVICQL